MARFSVALGVVAALLAAASSIAFTEARTQQASLSARAVAVQVSAPGQGGGVAGSAAAPPDAVNVAGGFAYPADGSGVRAGSVTASAFATRGAAATASASAEISSISLFNGEVTIDSVTARVKASASPTGAQGDVSASRVGAVTALGQAVAAGPGASVPLADWGTMTFLEQSNTSISAAGMPGQRASVVAVHVYLTAEHGGLPAGTDIQLGIVEATAQAEPVAAPKEPPAKRPTKIRPRPRTPTPTPTPRPAKPVPAPKVPSGPIVRSVPTDVEVALTKGGNVFPVYGAAAFSNDWGAARAHTGWHHGNDIYAPLGAPVLAVADGNVFSVGWNDIGGLRLWLRDLAGNEYYYAHLSAFSPLAIDGAQVEAGDVLGFVGNTGDAEGTPYHLHFEIHPVSLLHLGYDGVINPFPYLSAWQRLQDLDFVAVAGWAPPLASSSSVPRPGAILLQVSDISSASGLDPASLRRALSAAVGAAGDGSFRSARPTPPWARWLATRVAK